MSIQLRVQQPRRVIAIAPIPRLVVQAGIQGPRGPIGPSGSSSGAIAIPFAWGDATPKTITTLEAGKTVFTATIVIQSAFNGVGASLRLGDAGQSDRLISATQNDPSYRAEYETNPGYTYSLETEILLSITPGEGCTQGSGYILLEV